MERLYVYNGALTVIGVSFGLNAMPSLIAGERTIPLLLMAIGSVVIILSAIYGSLSTDPAEFEVSTGAVFALIVAACLSLTGTLLELLITT